MRNPFASACLANPYEISVASTDPVNRAPNRSAGSPSALICMLSMARPFLAKNSRRIRVELPDVSEMAMLFPLGGFIAIDKKDLQVRAAENRWNRTAIAVVYGAADHDLCRNRTARHNDVDVQSLFTIKP